MEDEFTNEIIEKESKEHSDKELQENLVQINNSVEKIKKLQKIEQSPYNKGTIRGELKEILEVLPEDIKVLSLTKDIYVSRATEEDEVIRVWHMKDLNKYTQGLKKRFTKKSPNINLNFPQRWE